MTLADVAEQVLVWERGGTPENSIRERLHTYNDLYHEHLPILREVDLEIRVAAYQWGWEFRYPEANVTTRTRLVIPVDTDVRFVTTSRDVIHLLFVPDLGVKQDAFPGHETVARTRATETGEYRLYCAELCGAGHARMHGTVDVRNGTAYRAWLERQSTPSTG
jgi:cytochrome c oxidase subunit 2